MGAVGRQGAAAQSRYGFCSERAIPVCARPSFRRFRRTTCTRKNRSTCSARERTHASPAGSASLRGRLAGRGAGPAGGTGAGTARGRARGGRGSDDAAARRAGRHAALRRLQRLRTHGPARRLSAPASAGAASPAGPDRRGSVRHGTPRQRRTLPADGARGFGDRYGLHRVGAPVRSAWRVEVRRGACLHGAAGWPRLGLSRGTHHPSLPDHASLERIARRIATAPPETASDAVPVVAGTTATPCRSSSTPRSRRQR